MERMPWYLHGTVHVKWATTRVSPSLCCLSYFSICSFMSVSVSIRTCSHTTMGMQKSQDISEVLGHSSYFEAGSLSFLLFSVLYTKLGGPQVSRQVFYLAPILLWEPQDYRCVPPHLDLHGLWESKRRLSAFPSKCVYQLISNPLSV